MRPRWQPSRLRAFLRQSAQAGLGRGGDGRDVLINSGGGSRRHVSKRGSSSASLPKVPGLPSSPRRLSCPNRPSARSSTSSRAPDTSDVHLTRMTPGPGSSPSPREGNSLSKSASRSCATSRPHGALTWALSAPDSSRRRLPHFARSQTPSSDHRSERPRRARVSWTGGAETHAGRVARPGVGRATGPDG
jgi:hypothetical protein